MKFERMIMEKESPEEIGYGNIKYNLTESSVRDVNINELKLNLKDIILCYGDHSGIPELRELISKKYERVTFENILVTTGACLALFIVNATLLDGNDRILVVNPNYATNIEVPKSLGFKLDLYTLSFEEKFSLDVEKLESMIKPSTKLISITYPHNPTGAMISEDILRAVVEIAEKHDCYLLNDETYRELTMGKMLPPTVSLSSKVITVESMSKSFGIPGIRIGWLATQSSELKERFLSTKEQVCICGSVVDEEIALQVIKQQDEILSHNSEYNKKAFKIMSEWINTQDYVEWVEPKGGVVCFPRIKSEVKLDIEKFYKILNEKYGTFVGPGHWFGHSDRYFRVGYAWPLEKELRKGLDCITKSIKESIY